MDTNIDLIKKYVEKLIENLPNESTNIGKIDLVLEGGLFNGSYLVGALYFLKEMEKRKYITIDRISGCSIGSIIGFLYYIDALDLIIPLYTEIINEFQNTFSLNIIKKIKMYINHRIPKDICLKLNGKLYISYNNIKNRKKIIKCTYKNIDYLLDTIIKSCFIPYVIDNQHMLYKNKYMDGINVYIFKQKPSKKILYLDLTSYNKITSIINIKNEKTNFNRILSGLLDIHGFFIKGYNTDMCSFVNDWNLIYKVRNKLKYIIEKIIVYIIYLINYFKKYISSDFNKNIFIKILFKIIYDIYCILLETYCF
jgi:hypothetical protein